ncbi:molybdopterin molybdotransferase [Paenibacillus algorifonticola]|uniref:Molybdopterin molybdenumtransferase n=1 Tax=Paenibacillus algorifonticola TaxID=684063 RepID=A0A1I1YE09_9BACL|nr:molybdopterin molybdotransferase MoeA [Paenibacillus algorifonticola]SFE17572.1 molybdopterin molybdotransferase [Paenibacillus algorifonticola]
MTVARVDRVDIKKGLSVNEAVHCLIERTLPGKVEQVLLQKAAQRVLAEDFYSPFPMPPFRRAAMDGYALHAAFTQTASPGNPIRLIVTGEVQAGAGEIAWHTGSGKRPLINEQLTAVRIFTGAPVPVGFDAVIRQEEIQSPSLQGQKLDAAAWGMSQIQINQPVQPGKNIAEAGEDLAENSLVIKKGTLLGSKEIAILASYGQERASVVARPIVAIIPVGDELLLPGQLLQPNRIYDANGFAVEAFLQEQGASVIRSLPIKDDAEVIADAIKQAAEQADLVITTGGISVGDYDCVARAADRLGFEPLFTKVMMRPGPHSSAFIHRGKLLISLSGNPAACYTGLVLLVKPLTQHLIGLNGSTVEWKQAVLMDNVDKPSPYPRYIRAFVWMEEGEWRVRPLPNDKSGNIAAFAGANALAAIPGEGLQAGRQAAFLSLT